MYTCEVRVYVCVYTCIHTSTYTYTYIYTNTYAYTHLASERKGMLIYATTWVSLEDMMVGEIRTFPQSKYCLLLLVNYLMWSDSLTQKLEYRLQRFGVGRNEEIIING